MKSIKLIDDGAIYPSVEQLISEGHELLVTLRKDGVNSHMVRSFDSMRHLENFTNQQMRIHQRKVVGVEKYEPINTKKP